MAEKDPFSQFAVEEVADPFAEFEAKPSKEPDAFSQFEVADDEPTTGEVVKGVGAEILAGGVGSVAGGIIGGAIGSIVPVVGTAAGAIAGTALGGFAGGFLGSLWAQDIEDQEDVSIGRALGAATVSAIPLGGAAAKGVKGIGKITASVVGRAAGREAVKGAAMGTAEATIRTAVDEGRLPTKEEFATYAGAGAVFGGALGAALPKVGKTFDKFLGKTSREIDEGIASGAIEFKDLKRITQVEGAEGEKVLRGTVETVKARVRSEAAADILIDQTPFGKIKDRLLSGIAPSKVVGKEIRNEALSFRKQVAADEELGGRIEKKVAAAIKKDPEAERMVVDFLSGKDTVPNEKLGSLVDELSIYRSRLSALQGQVANQLEVDYMAKLGPQRLATLTDEILKLRQRAETRKLKGKPELQSIRKELAGKLKAQRGLEATPKLIAKIKKTRREGTFTRKEYRMWTDSEFVPDVKLRGDAVEEIAQGFKRQGTHKNIDRARRAADEHLSKLEGRSARSRKLDPNKGGAQPLKSALMRKKDVGPAESAWLGEITDTGERIRGTLTGVGKLVARNKTDANIATMLQKNGLAVPDSAKAPGLVELKLKAGEATGLHVRPEVQASLNRLYIDGAVARSNIPIIAGLQDLYTSSVGLSKAVKVLLNPPSYAVQVYGNAFNLSGMGANPFANARKGWKLAMADFGGFEHMMSPKGSKDRQAFLKEMNDMSRFGIKGENISESEIRDAFENGLFSKALEKPVGFFGKAYSVPDTIGRYIGWKAQQKAIKKMYPGLNPEQVKKLGADMINDFYQNYDRTSPLMKSLARMGLMPQFATFTAEFMRNQYNQAKAIKQMLGGTFGAELGLDISKANLTAMRMEGAKRLTALTTLYAGTAGALAAINSDGGVTEHNEQAIKNSIAPWDRNKSLAIRMSEDGKSGSYANMSYIAPHALGLAAIDAAMNDQPLDSLTNLLVDEFIGEGSFVNRGLMEAVNNRNNRGDKISYSKDDLTNAKERMAHFFKETFRPGIAREVKKMDEAMRGMGDLTTMQVMARQIGYRMNSFNIAENNKFLMMEHLENANGSKREYTKARDRGNLRPEDLEAVYQRANEAYKENMRGIAESNDNLKKTNHSEAERIEVMKKAHVSSKDILATLNGTVRDIPRVKLPSTADTYEGLPEGESAKRKAIMEIRKTDRALATRLMHRMKREKSDARRGVTTQEGLMKNLDVAERARMIMAHPNPTGYLREMQRKGIATAKVVELVRLMQRAQ